ncbi:MAG: hypothetical protein JNL10_19610 [Verrucomicrobiales bacterium]|nr:hypothetical protein [Verrucomicrobiales bacterium]
MLRLENRTPPRRQPRTRGSHPLAVAWLYGELAVAVMEDGRECAVWTAPEVVAHPRDLGPSLQTALKSLGSSARTVSMVVAHEELIQCRVEMPRMRGSLRQRFLQRQVDLAPSPCPPLHWASCPAAAAATADAALLSLMPRTFHDAMVCALVNNGLTPTWLVPFSDLLGKCRPGAEDFSEEFILHVAAIGTRTELLVIRGDGTPVVTRTSTPELASGNTRLTGEVLRTLQFVQQTFGNPVSRICWLGADSMPAGARGNASIEAISRQVPEAGSARYWAGQLASLPDRHGINLLAPEQRQASGRRWVTRMHRALAAFSLLAAVTFLIFSEQVRSQEQSTIRRLKDQLSPLERREQELRLQAQAHDRQRAVIRLDQESPGSLAPLCILGKIGDQLPSELRLTQVQVLSRDPGWTLKISGQTRPATASIRDPLNRFSNSLCDSPLFVQWSQPSDSGKSAESRDAWRMRWTEAWPVASTPKAPTGFVLEGRIP